MKRFFLAVAALAFFALTSRAEVVLPPFFCDNMVIQRNTDAALWGTADKGAQVTITTSWDKKKTVVSADSQSGKFFTRVATPDAGGPYTITFSDGRKSKVTISNVLSGDVWFCSGQSNMEMPVKGYDRQPSQNGMKYIVAAKPSRPIRICKVTRKSSKTPLDVCECTWTEHTPEAVGNISATAYYFADMLEKTLDIPIGILVSSWGGSTIETWIPRDIIEKDFPEISTKHLDDNSDTQRDHKSASLLFNGQVNPLVPFTFKGIIWYQGCSNRGNPEQYTRLQPAYVKMMREKFENPGAPFYFVQIAPHKHSNPNSFKSGYFVEAQAKTLDSIPNSGMAATTDIGEFATIHPCKKEEVGQRLAFLALEHTYGMKGFCSDAPRYTGVEFKDGKAIVSFTKMKGGLAPLSYDLPGFELAGEDRVFHKAIASSKAKGLKNNQIEVSCSEVPNPVAVRYCFRNWCEGSVFNNYGIPAIPFRSDNWDDIKE